MNVNEEGCMPTRTIGERHRGPAERDWADVRTGRPIPVHHVVARYGNKGLEVLRVPLKGRGETLPVFSAGSAARGHHFAAAPGGGWYVIEVVEADATAMFSPDGSFSAVLSFTMVHHVPSATVQDRLLA
jgi:hypothetical protein